jgi:apolipoprotein N-acyltransferase
MLTADRMRTRLGTCACVAASAVAFALYARVEWPWLVLGWVGLVPWLAMLDRTTTLRGAAAVGSLMSEAFVLAVFTWLPSAIANYTAAPWIVALVAVVLIAPVLQPQFIALALARHMAQRRMNPNGMDPRPLVLRLSKHAWPGGARGDFWRPTLIAACAYVGTEWAFPKLFADTLGHGLYASALLRQAADLGGAHGLTFVLIIANECGLAMVRVNGSARRRAVLLPAAYLVALLVGLLAYGRVRSQQFNDTINRTDGITAGIVQADITHYGELAAQMGTYDAARLILDTHFALSNDALEGGRVDLLVWPETVYPTTFGTPKSADGAAFDREIGAFATAAGVPLVFGAYDAEDGDEFNAAFFLQPGSRRPRPVRNVSQGRAVSAHRTCAGPTGLGGGAALAAMARHVETRHGWAGRLAGVARRAHAADCAAHLLRRVVPIVRDRGGPPGCRGHRHPLERLLVRVRQRAAAHFDHLGVPQHRDAPPAGARH